MTLTLNGSIQSAMIACMLLVAACSNPQNKTSDEVGAPQSATITVTDAIAPIRSTEMVIKFQIGADAPRDWTITPELAPDTLAVQCPPNEVTDVTFTTDMETRTFSITPGDPSPQFDILVNNDISALTEIRYIPPITRYVGDFLPSRSTAGDIEADIGPILDTYFSEDAPGIILAIVEGDEVLYQTAMGLRDIDAGTPRQVGETFDIASVSKEFTAVAILQLADRNALALDDPLSKYFDDLPNGDEITLDHLLTHTHCLPQIRAAASFDSTLPRNLEVALEHIRELSVVI